ncbi:tRNA pseudouridine(38-40) synthase TruA [Branchiibius sp. NY16-3462-2]|uniref:tRNA pseudouridine(38-40) synthase TruA n=1 Tax=Branchiibius sp. NY16-3462-2 TaxID=1807500 RepID=UPI0007968F1A|nr:tRNA pseudouridine(38-40) synthase TruA [Branchiibius sp. NY16-3462-2]KYH46063.1 tRNA pseudouridine(38-40) synthase [Branchiibius sp. NY16-3462-2]
MRLRVDFGYDGAGFAGWAAQPGLRTVESELTAAWATVLRTPAPKLTTAGRTDAGVHARGAVVHLDVDPSAYDDLPGRSDRTPDVAAVTRLNGVLPQDIRVRAVSVAPEGFDARFSASWRRYSYRLADGWADPIRRGDTVSWRKPLDVEAMHEAANALVGLNDFAAFCKRREGATTVRTLLRYDWSRDDDGVLVATVIADAFCHSMVRSLVGSVVPVGEGRVPRSWPGEKLAARQRDSAILVMPPHGLCLEEVRYPRDDQLGVRARESRSVRTLED